MSQIIEKIRKMDAISEGITLLLRDLEQYQAEGFSERCRVAAYQRLSELRSGSSDLNLEVTGLFDKIQELVANPMDAQLYDTVYAFVLKIQEIFGKLYSYNIHSEETYKEECIENYYGTRYSRNALLVYILHPFIFEDMVPEHTNQVEARLIAEALRDKGYNVDLVNTRYTESIDNEKYDLVIGAGKSFEDFCMNHSEKSKAIYYLTTSSSYFNNMAEMGRLRAFERRNHFMPQFERVSMDLLNLSALVKADGAICLGNEHTVSTYEGVFANIYPLNVTGVSDFPLPEINKTSEAKSFLWYGGTGPIHKGLDLCIEAFRQLPDLKLHIVGEVTSEFYNAYKDDIENGDNIFYYGFLRKDDEVFRQVCEECAYCIFPSCSEGQSTSVVSTLFSGIIPVCTKEVGIDVESAGGVLIDSIEISDLVSVMRELSEAEPEAVVARQQTVYQYAVENHSVDKFRKNISDILDELAVGNRCRKTLVIMGGKDELYNYNLNEVADAYRNLGWRVVYGNYLSDEKVKELLQEGIDRLLVINNVGWIIPLEEGEGNLWDELGIPSTNYILDHPMYYDYALNQAPKLGSVWCVDRKHVDYVKRFYPEIRSCSFVPLAGDNKLDGYHKTWRAREIDVLYVGSYKGSMNDSLLESGGKEYLEILLQNKECTTEEIVERCLREKEPVCEEEALKAEIVKHKRVDLYLMTYVRVAVIEALIKAGINVTVYGGGWEHFEYFDNSHFIYRGTTSQQECLELMKNSKIVLNVMPRFKEGIHDRVINAMLAGAIALSDSSGYLNEVFEPGVDYVEYDIERLDLLPGIVKNILSEGNEEMRKRAYEKAVTRHRWIHRIEELEKMDDSI